MTQETRENDYHPNIEQILNDCQRDLPRTGELYGMYGYQPTVLCAPKKHPICVSDAAFKQVRGIVTDWFASGTITRGGKAKESVDVNDNVRIRLSTGTSGYYPEKKSNGKRPGRYIEINVEDQTFKSSVPLLAEDRKTIRTAASFVLQCGGKQDRWHNMHRFVDPALRNQGLGSRIMSMIETVIQGVAVQLNADQTLAYEPAGEITTAANQVGLALFLAQHGFYPPDNAERKKLRGLLIGDKDIAVGEIHYFHDSGLYQGVMYSKRHVQQQGGDKKRGKLRTSDQTIREVVRLWNNEKEEMFNNSWGINMRKTIPKG